MVCIVSAGRPPHIKELTLMLKERCEGLKSIILNINKTKGNTVLSGSFETIWGSDIVETSICGLRFRLSPLSFCQVNTRQTEKLYGKALEFAALSGNETVLDLYCGAGAIGLIASRHARRVIGAEIVEDAINDANINAQLNNICNAEFICADATEASAKLKCEGFNPDVIFLDPPRKGLSPDVIKASVEMSPGKIVYVSCDPATLARDLKLFDSLGYGAVKVTAVDMFPRTRHVETVVLMSRVKEK
jgi:23S rRNA (uracil1939-C5)-methyltransferase